MSAAPITSDSRFKTLLFIAMFLFADIAIPAFFPAEELEEINERSFAVYNYGASKDAMIDSSAPNNNFGTLTTASIGPNAIIGESRMLIDFNINLSSSANISSAVLDLTCSTNATVTGTTFFVASLSQAFQENSTNWLNADNTTGWDMPGADGDADRGAWEPPHGENANGTFSLNVTTFVQSAAAANSTTLGFVISATGAQYSCSTKEALNPTASPTLLVTWGAGTPSAKGQLTPNFVTDGNALMSSDFMLNAELDPAFSWMNMQGSQVEFQLSYESSFKSELDSYWYLNSNLNSTFQMSSSSGSVNIPSENAFINGSSYFYRLRAVNGDQVGDWNTGYFHSPDLSVSDNGDGTATILFNSDSMGLITDAIEDTTLDESNNGGNTALGSQTAVVAGMSLPTTDQYGLLRFNANTFGMHQNATIEMAELVMTRSSYNSAAVVSLHQMDENANWTEESATFNSPNGVGAWNDGGRDLTSSALDSLWLNQTSSEFRFDITSSYQHWLDDGVNGDLSYWTTVRGIDESHSANTNIQWHSTDYSTSGDQPFLEITYSWGSGASPYPVNQLTPIDGSGAWTMTGFNLSGNTTPSLTWDGTNSSTNSYDIIFQLSSDRDFRNIIAEVDTSSNNDFAASDGIFNLSASHGLVTGGFYGWRMAHMGSDGHASEWTESNFFVPEINSTYLGNDLYELRFKQGNSSSLLDQPSCRDTYIDSGSPTDNYGSEMEIQTSYNSFSQANILWGCDLSGHMLPNGIAVTDASLSMALSYAGSSPSVGAWENLQHNWTENGVTWNTYDGTNNWGVGGASGWERGSLLDSTTIPTSSSTGTTFEWNITQGVQSSMRGNGQVDVILTVLNTGSNPDALLYSNEASGAYLPELVMIYTPGSNSMPSNPILVSPANASWSVESGIEPAPILRPELSWSMASNITIAGWVVELDTISSFDGPDLQTFASWNSLGFDMQNQTFTTNQDLANGKVWNWRVRGVSSTNQLGGWSSTNNFLLPDLTTWRLDSNTSAIELHHEEAIPELNLPSFTDTWVVDSGSYFNSAQNSSNVLKVGTLSSGARATSLLHIPLNEIPSPSNAHVQRATINLYANWGASTSQHISIHPSAVAWTSSANGLTYDGVNNWSANGSLGASDYGVMVDVRPVTHASWNQFDITEIVQEATLAGQTYIGLTIMGDIGNGLVEFASTDASSNSPWLNVTWTTGNASSVAQTGSPSLPIDGSILWGTGSHAMLPAETPTLTWTHQTPSSVDDWRLFIWVNGSNERDGWLVHDTRDSLTGFDIANLSWTPAISQTSGKTQRWFVQPIINDILGPRSSNYHYHLPTQMSDEINSTDAWLNVVEGALVPDISYAHVIEDTWIYSASQSTNYGNAATINLGQSSSGYRSHGLLEIDVSVLPVPAPYEVVSATVKMYRLSGDNSDVEISVSDLYRDFSEVNATWNEYETNQSWSQSGAIGTTDSAFSTSVSTVSSTGWISWDVTQLAQAALARGDETLRLLFQPVNGTGTHLFASSSNIVSLRPQLNMTIRTGSQWLPSESTSLMPASGSTMWNLSASLPSGMDNIDLSWSSSHSNVSYHLQRGTDSSFINVDDIYSNDTGTWGSGDFDVANQTYSLLAADAGIDEWNFWRVRSIQGHIIGNWSQVNHFRVPGDHGSDDGTGNLTLNLQRGTVFVNTSIVPLVPDVTIDSSFASTNTGSSSALYLGVSNSGSGESRILMEFDLNELPFPANMTPTSTVLSLYRTGISGGQGLTVAVYPCSSYSESGATWNNAPTCSTTEITRSTIGVVPPTGWLQWDITSLAQSNVANGNYTLTVMLAVVGTPGASHSFYSSDSSSTTYRPQLSFEYVDNSNGTQPPAQPTLVYPTDGDVLYDNSNWTLASIQRPVLQWNPVANATAYVLTISNNSGQTKFRSWTNIGFSGANYSFQSDLSSGESYQWWVQAINGSIPGPASSRWSFAIGNPINNTDNSDNTYTYWLRHGAEVADFGHVSILDSTIKSANADTAFEDSDLQIGSTSSGDEMRAFVVLDTSSLPLNPNARVHSASVGLYIKSTSMFPGVPMTTFTISAHPLLGSGYTPLGTTWNNATASMPWGAPGLQSGVDYGLASGTVTFNVAHGDTGWVWLDLSQSGLDLTSSHPYVLIGSGQAYLNIAHSQDSNEDHRPVMLMNYTTVDSIAISPGLGTTTDADTPVQFSFSMYDANSQAIAGNVEWNAENGSISSAGMYIPHTVGIWDVSACFGLRCEIIQIQVTPGAAVSHVVTPLSGTITADESFDIQVKVLDQYSNQVTGENINWQATNGSFATISPPSGWNEAATFMPWAKGPQVVSVEWNGVSINVNIQVHPGIADHFEIGNCADGDLIVPAGTTCQLAWQLYDVHDNMLPDSAAGNVSWTVQSAGGNISNGAFEADHIGEWIINLTSASGVNATTNITVVYGVIDSLELSASDLYITADEVIYLNTTRIDIKGNRLQIDLPAENWTIASGWITPGTGGAPAVWEPEDVGNKVISASYDGLQSSVYIGVSHGILIDLEVDITTLKNITADESSVLKAFGVDSKANRWPVVVQWRVTQDPQNNQGWLSDTNWSQTTFDPTSVGSFDVSAVYTDEESNFYNVDTNYVITHGILAGIVFESPATNDPHWSDGIFEITADEDVQIAVSLADSNGNQIDNNILNWTVNDVEVTSEMVLSNFLWDGEQTIGEYVIKATNGSFFDIITVNVSHGRALVVTHAQSANSVEAGNSLTVQMTGTDAAGNQFAQDVSWAGGDLSKIADGAYQYDATTAGSYTLTYTLPGAQGGDWNVEVSPTYLDHFDVVIDKSTVEQLEKITMSIEAFDRYNNPLNVPSGAQLSVQASGRGEISGSGNSYTVTTLEEGAHSMTVTSNVNGNVVSASASYNVTGNMAGFFAAGGTLYYVGAGLIGLVSLILFVLVIILFRGSTDDYDDEDWEDEDEEDVEVKDQRPILEQIQSGPSEPAPEDNSAEETGDGITVDDDGVEWYEDETGVWWSRGPNDEEWEEFVE